MTVLDFIDHIKRVSQIDLAVKVGDVDINALSTLEFLYKSLPEDATYADAERVLAEALWWHVTINTFFEPVDKLDGKEELE